MPLAFVGVVIDTFFAKDFLEAETALADWMTYLDAVALYGPDDPLFPATAITAQADRGFAATGIQRKHWKTTEPVRKIVRLAFAALDLPNYGPHALSPHAGPPCRQNLRICCRTRRHRAKPWPY
jgi:hypothetical protein